MMRYTKMGMVCAAAMMASGCSFLGIGGHQTARSDMRMEAQMATAAAVADVQLQVGRENLRDGNLATAARYLRSAQAHPETRAEATNALGVVYAKLGRLDVAGDYFAKAAELEPDNAKYLTNLARLERDVSFAALRVEEAKPIAPVRSAEAAVPAAAPAVAAAAKAEPSAVAATLQRVERLSRNEIHIRTVSADEAPANFEVVSRNPAPALAMAKEDETLETLPEMIEAPGSKAPESKAKTIEYPQRVEL